jgi:hypothetical protein
MKPYFYRISKALLCAVVSLAPSPVSLGNGRDRDAYYTRGIHVLSVSLRDNRLKKKAISYSIMAVNTGKLVKRNMY